MKRLSAICAAAVTALAAVPTAQADPQGLTRVISDSFSNPSSQHASAVEPDTFAAGNTLVVASQVGRFFDGGGSGIGYATTTDGGTSWTHGVLPEITSHQSASSPFERVTDPSVAYDAKHDVWMVSSIPLRPRIVGPRVFVSRSTDGGASFGDPVTVARKTPHGKQDFDKNWTACDDHPASPFYGHCYTAFDDFGNVDRLKVSTSTDGGRTWGPTRGVHHGIGLGVQPVVQRDGDVVVPTTNGVGNQMIAFRSVDGGEHWKRPVKVADIHLHHPAGNLRSGDGLPSVDTDARGKVYVTWEDCRFRAGCSGNDIVISSSTNGRTWSAPVRIPIGTVTDGSDNFIPGLGIKPGTSGSSAKLGLTYYSYRNAACGTSCKLEVGYVQSDDGGASWTAPVRLVRPFGVDEIANTSQGRMVGDYISTSWLGSKAFGAFAVGQPSTSGKPFDEGIFVPAGGLNVRGATRTSAPAEAAVASGGERSAKARR
jgi:hypothetical protein